MTLRFGAALALALPLLVAAGTASARQWNATPEAMAEEYSIIQDNRPGNELVMLMWLSPQMVADKDVQDVLSKSLVIGALDAHIGADGKFTFTPLDQVVAKDAQGKELHVLTGDQVPPSATGAVQTLGAIFRQALGPVGTGFQWFVFDGASIKSCTPGSGFSVQIAGTTYTYDTPIPGCPKS